MSIRHVSAVLDHYPNGDARKLVLLAVAEQANEATWICWPSIERLAKRACVSERHAQRTIDALEAEGVLEVMRRRGRTKTNRYRFRYDRVTELPSLVDVRSPDLDPFGGFGPVDRPVDNCTQETGHGVTFVQEKVTPASIKGDIAMSSKPLEPSKKPLTREAVDNSPVDKSDHQIELMRQIVGELATEWDSE